MCPLMQPLAHQETRGSKQFRRSRFWVIAGVVTVYVTLVFIRNPGINTNPQARVLDMVYGKAHRPYQYRCLIPSIVRIATAAVPTPVKAAMSRSVSPSLFYPMRWEGTFATGYSILLALLLLSLLGFIAATRYL